MRKKLLSLALALVMCLGLTVPAFAASPDDYSANGYTDPASENVVFSVVPIGVATIRVSSWKTEEYTAYVFDQDCIVTRKDGFPLTHFILDDGVDRYYVDIGNKNFPYLYVDIAGISADDGYWWLFQFGPDESEGETDWSPYMISKKGLDSLPIEDDYSDFAVTVVAYRPLSSQPAVPAASNFTDVETSDYFAESVAWAIEKEITNGTGDNKFSPGQNCTNAQILTFIWRAYGKPESTIGNPFTNTIPDAYAKAAVWAYEKGMVSGTAFDVDKPCTRAMAVTYMWQAAGSPTPSIAVSFTDVPAGSSYAPAVAWALEKGITTGTSAATFSPDEICNRGQIVTFLHRNLA